MISPGPGKSSLAELDALIAGKYPAGVGVITPEVMPFRVLAVMRNRKRALFELSPGRGKLVDISAMSWGRHVARGVAEHALYFDSTPFRAPPGYYRNK